MSCTGLPLIRETLLSLTEPPPTRHSRLKCAPAPKPQRLDVRTRRRPRQSASALALTSRRKRDKHCGKFPRRKKQPTPPFTLPPRPPPKDVSASSAVFSERLSKCHYWGGTEPQSLFQSSFAWVAKRARWYSIFCLWCRVIVCRLGGGAISCWGEELVIPLLTWVQRRCCFIFG